MKKCFLKLKLILAKALVSKSIGQLFYFGFFSIICLIVLYIIGLRLGKIQLFETLMSFINPGNAWRIETETVQAAENAGQVYAATGKNPIDWFLPFVGIVGTIVFTGMLVAVFNNYIINWVKRIRNGLINYNLSDHIVIIGFDSVVPTIIKQLIGSKEYSKTKILVISKRPAPEVSDLVHTKVQNMDYNRIVYMHTEHYSKEELLKVNSTLAREIFVISDEPVGKRDTENMRIMMILHNIHSEAKQGKTVKRIPLTMWFDNETTYAAMQLNDIKQDWKELFIFRPYSFYGNWASRLIVNNHYRKGNDCVYYPPLDRNGINKDSDKHVHLVVMGLNHMGIAVVKEAAHMLHFPNFNEKRLNNSSIITIIDDNADQKIDFFKAHNPGYFAIAPTVYWDATQKQPESDTDPFTETPPANGVKNYLDVRFQFIKGRIESDTVRKWLVNEARKKDQYLTIAICFNNDAQNLGTALYLPEEIYYNGTVQGRHDVNIFVRQESSGAMVEMLNRAAISGNNKRYAHVKPFGMKDNSFDLQEQDKTTAKLMKYIYDYYYSPKHEDEHEDEHEHKLPEDLPKDLKELNEKWDNEKIPLQWSNIYLADSLAFKLRSIGYDISCGEPLVIDSDLIDDLARVEHRRWNMEKLLMGYRAPNETESKTWDKDKKQNAKKNLFIHHDIIPYDDLKNDDKKNDLNIIEYMPKIVAYLKEKGLLHFHTVEKENATSGSGDSQDVIVPIWEDLQE